MTMSTTTISGNTYVIDKAGELSCSARVIDGSFKEYISGELLKNLPGTENLVVLLGNLAKDGLEFPVAWLDKLYQLSLDNQDYQDLYNFYMDMHDGKGTAYTHIQTLRENAEKKSEENLK